MAGPQTAPYPSALAGVFRLRDGTEVRLRPLCPQDEPLLHDLAAHMTAEDLRRRFFTAMRELPHPLAVRLSHLDYEREMALVALPADADIALGVARYAADPDRRVAEYAIAVRSDWHGRGLGYLLLTRLIEVARERGVGALVGTVMHDNRAMLQMCRDLSFALAADPDDASLVRVTKPLAGPETA